jgi:uncharacterized protein (DUF58 family)
VDLAELREYQHSDDVRHIDWNVTARLQTPHVRVFNEERDTAAWFLIDTTQSLEFGSQAVRKRMVATELVGVLARLFSRHGNRVGAAFYGGEVDTVIPARSGRRHVLHILNSMLSRPTPKQCETRLADLVQTAVHAIPRRSLVFIVSDFISAPGWEMPLAQVAERHETLAVRLFDPLEQELPDLGIVTMQDAETGEQLVVDTHDRGFRRRFAQAAQQREEALRHSFAQAGVDVLELSTDDDLMDAVLRFADLRRQRGRMAAGAPLSRPMER